MTSIVIPASITNIDSFAFYLCESLKTINYRGSQEQWEAITIGYEATELFKNATINYNYKGA